ncbi:MAG: periplasmic heavy metal sensor [Prolixibacteraceae bacterium]|nr:periplasmic heavy metal sensor [Prolixibacteraceae bacterium]
MRSKNTYRILIGIIIILLAYTVSMTASYIVHRQNDNKAIEQTENQNIEVPTEQRTRFFREQLNLRADQMEIFRNLSRDFNRKGNAINLELQTLRIVMVEELGKENPDSIRLNSIADEIGKLHTELKQATIDYYLKMKTNCDEEQQLRLNEIFISILNNDEDVSLPRRGGGRFGRFN